MQLLTRQSAILLIAGLGAGCALLCATGSNAAERKSIDAASFRKDVLPILVVNCAACHQAGSSNIAMGALDLTPTQAYASLVGIASTQVDMLRVKPGSPSASYLSRKLRGTLKEVNGMGNSMPILVGPLPKSEIDLIDRWIKEGARNN